jgi:hypothetical protein
MKNNYKQIWETSIQQGLNDKQRNEISLTLPHSVICCYLSRKSKGKVVPVLFLTDHHVMKAYWVSGCIAPRILDLGTRWRWVVSFTTRPLYSQGKSRWYPLYRRLGGTQSRSGSGGEEKNSQPLPGLEPPIIQPVDQGYTTELYRLPVT